MSEKRNVIVNFHLSAQEKKDLQRASELEGRPMANFIRQAVLKAAVDTLAQHIKEQKSG